MVIYPVCFCLNCSYGQDCHTFINRGPVLRIKTAESVMLRISGGERAGESLDLNIF